MSRFDQVDLSKLPAPDAVHPVDFEDILSLGMADFLARNPDYDVRGLESDPAIKVLETGAYLKSILLDDINQRVRAVMLATATGNDLENLAALLGVARAVEVTADPEADPAIEEVLESDDRLRARTQLALEAFSTAGPEGAYIFHALTADASIKSVSATSPNPGQVLISVLSNEGDGTPDQAMLDAVQVKLSDKDTRPLTDQVTIQAATITTYAITGTLSILSGPDAAIVQAEADAKLQAYAEGRHALGRDIELSGLMAAAHVAGVERVTLTSPAASISINDTEAAFCSGITLAVEVIDG